MIDWAILFDISIVATVFLLGMTLHSLVARLNRLEEGSDDADACSSHHWTDRGVVGHRVKQLDFGDTETEYIPQQNVRFECVHADCVAEKTEWMDMHHPDGLTTFTQQEAYEVIAEAMDNDE